MLLRLGSFNILFSRRRNIQLLSAAVEILLFGAFPSVEFLLGDFRPSTISRLRWPPNSAAVGCRLTHKMLVAFTGPLFLFTNK